MKDLILLHGALGHSSNFDAYEAYLGKYFNVHKILFAGHGGTAIPANGISMQGYVDQLHDYCEAHSLQQFDVFGYSMGGYVALAYALQYPGRISSLLTLASKLDWTEEGATKESRMLNPDVIAEKVPKYAAQLALLHGEDHWKILLPAVAELMIGLGRTPLLTAGSYGQMQIRAQLMVGDKDVMVSLAETLQASKAIPEARFAVLPATKHPIEQVRPVLLMDMMKDFWSL